MREIGQVNSCGFMKKVTWNKKKKGKLSASRRNGNFSGKFYNFESKRILWLKLTQNLFPYLFFTDLWINALRNFVGNIG